MGGQSQQQPVFYDADMGQYYTQSTPPSSPNNPMNSLSTGFINPRYFGNGGERTYLNGFGQSQALQQAAPYEYADVSLETLFPMIQNAMQGSQGNAMQGGNMGGLLGATGSASSGAGRFM
jgi:hypothetical protein